MSEGLVEIKKTQDDIAKLLNDFQESHKNLVADGKSNSESLSKMGEDFGKMTDKLQDAVLKIEAEKKAREELELTIARVQESGGKKEEAKSSPEYVKAFNEFLVTRRLMNRETEDAEIKAMIRRESGRLLTDEQLMGVKTLLVGSNPDGGYIVPTERQAAIIRRRFEQTPMRGVANAVTIGTTDTDFILDDGEFGSQKVGEVDLRAGTGTSQIGVITIPTHEQSTECVATEKVLDDAVWNLEAWLTGKIAQRFSRIENREFMVGAAAHEAQGICTLPDWVALGNYEIGRAHV